MGNSPSRLTATAPSEREVDANEVSRRRELAVLGMKTSEEHMTKIIIKMHIIQDNENAAEFEKAIKECADDLSFQWNIYDEIVDVTSRTSIILHRERSTELELAEEKVGQNPLDDKLKDEYESLLEMYSNREAIIEFETAMSLNVDLNKNQIFFSNNDSSECEWGYFDSFYDEYIARLNLALVMAFVFAKPHMHIWNIATDINDIRYIDENYVKEIIPIGTLKEYKLIKKESISYKEALMWIKNHTSLCGNRNKSPSAFSALTYVFNRQYHEGLIYSIIGLESIYSPGKSGISYTLQKRINKIFPMISKDEIKKMYALRSKFVHGELAISNCDLLVETLDDYEQFSGTSFMAMSLLFETVRMLIANDADSINFTEIISYDFS